MCDIIQTVIYAKEDIEMKHVKTLNTKLLQNTVVTGGCGECQTSFKSACKNCFSFSNQAFVN